MYPVMNFITKVNQGWNFYKKFIASRACFFLTPMTNWNAVSIIIDRSWRTSFDFHIHGKKCFFNAWYQSGELILIELGECRPETVKRIAPIHVRCVSVTHSTKFTCTVYKHFRSSGCCAHFISRMKWRQNNMRKDHFISLCISSKLKIFEGVNILIDWSVKSEN